MEIGSIIVLIIVVLIAIDYVSDVASALTDFAHARRVINNVDQISYDLSVLEDRIAELKKIGV